MGRGTRIHGAILTEVVDGDTIKVELVRKGNHGSSEERREETLRLLGVDTEESAIGSKPVTKAGLEASRLAKEYFGCDEEGFPIKTNEDDVVTVVDLEFDTVEPEHVCLQRHRGYYGRLLCYVHKNGENYNLKTVREGWSAYFVKYGRSRLYHAEFLAAEAQAQAEQRLIWNRSVTEAATAVNPKVGNDDINNHNNIMNTRNYATLIPWWNLRDSAVMEYRTNGLSAGVLTVPTDMDVILMAAKHENAITVFCDLGNGITEVYPGTGALLEVGTSTQSFYLWIPYQDTNDDNDDDDGAQKEAKSIQSLIKNRYAGEGRRGYAFVSGMATLYDDGKPEIVLTRLSQISDVAPVGGAGGV